MQIVLIRGFKNKGVIYYHCWNKSGRVSAEIGNNHNTFTSRLLLSLLLQEGYRVSECLSFVIKTSTT